VKRHALPRPYSIAENFYAICAFPNKSELCKRRRINARAIRDAFIESAEVDDGNTLSRWLPDAAPLRNPLKHHPKALPFKTLGAAASRFLSFLPASRIRPMAGRITAANDLLPMFTALGMFQCVERQRHRRNEE
jgi:hypothetical protein